MDANLKHKVAQLVSDITSQTQTLHDLNGLFRSLMKSPLQRTLHNEIHLPLGRKSLPPLCPDSAPHTDPETPNYRRNGHLQHTVRGELGELPLDTPPDRLGTFEPQLIPQHQRRLTGFDEKIQELLGLGLRETEGARFGRNCLMDGNNRGLNDIFIVCGDGLTGTLTRPRGPDVLALEGVFPSVYAERRVPRGTR